MADGGAYMRVLVPLLNYGGSEAGFGRGTREWNNHTLRNLINSRAILPLATLGMPIIIPKFERQMESSGMESEVTETRCDLSALQHHWLLNIESATIIL
jgi:hypothetical protein